MKRSWTIYLDSGDEGESEQEVIESLNDLVTCLLRLGGVGAISPLRRGYRDEKGTIHYENEGVRFAYDSYAPGINPPEEQQEVEQDVPVEDLAANGAEEKEVVAASAEGGD